MFMSIDPNIRDRFDRKAMELRHGRAGGWVEVADALRAEHERSNRVAEVLMQGHNDISDFINSYSSGNLTAEECIHAIADGDWVNKALVIRGRP